MLYVYRLVIWISLVVVRFISLEKSVLKQSMKCCNSKVHEKVSITKLHNIHIVTHEANNKTRTPSPHWYNIKYKFVKGIHHRGMKKKYNRGV